MQIIIGGILVVMTETSYHYAYFESVIIKLSKLSKIFEPGHEKMCHMSYANNKGADPRSLISAFVFRCLDSIISLDSIAEISRL